MCIFDTHLGFRKRLLEKNKISHQKHEEKKDQNNILLHVLLSAHWHVRCNSDIFLRISLLKKVELFNLRLFG